MVSVWLLGYICSWNVGRLGITLSYVLLWRYSDASENNNSNVSFWKDKVLLRMTLWGDPDMLFWFSLLLSNRVIGVSMRYFWRAPSPQASENYLAAFGHRMLMLTLWAKNSGYPIFLSNYNNNLKIEFSCGSNSEILQYQLFLSCRIRLQFNELQWVIMASFWHFLSTWSFLEQNCSMYMISLFFRSVAKESFFFK